MANDVETDQEVARLLDLPYDVVARVPRCGEHDWYPMDPGAFKVGDHLVYRCRGCGKYQRGDAFVLGVDGSRIG